MEKTTSNTIYLLMTALALFIMVLITGTTKAAGVCEEYQSANEILEKITNKRKMIDTKHGVNLETANQIGETTYSGIRVFIVSAVNTSGKGQKIITIFDKNDCLLKEKTVDTEMFYKKYFTILQGS